MSDARDTERLATLAALQAHRWWAYRACAPDDDNPAVAAADPSTSVLVWLTPDQEAQQARHTREEQAKALCGRCPLLQQCRTYALGDEHGPRERWDIWGGMTARERDQHRQDQARHRREQQQPATAAPVELQLSVRDLAVLHALAAHRTPRAVATAAGLTVARANWHRAKLVTLLHLDPTTTTRTQLLYAAGGAGLLDPRSQILPDRDLTPAIPSRQARSALIRTHGRQLLLPTLRDYIRLLHATNPRPPTAHSARTRRPKPPTVPAYGEQLRLTDLPHPDQPAARPLQLISRHHSATDTDMAVAA